MGEIRWLTTDSLTHVEELLRASGNLEVGESIRRLGVAGEGNMNVVLRATIASPQLAEQERTLIVKQSRPFVAKYDSIPAPLERVEYEAAFYKFAEHRYQISAAMPRMLGWVPEEFVLILEDLGSAADATYLYAERPRAELPAFVPELLGWLHSLHKHSRGNFDFDCFRNRPLRALNHAHIFEIPFRYPAAIDLDGVCPGLADATATLRQDNSLRARALELGEVYLSDGDCLLHGDFYPGSWLITTTGARVIDPEFCFAGPAEFDLGIMLAHLQIIGYPEADLLVSQSVLLDQSRLDLHLIRKFAAVEVLRRLLGVAQLPITTALGERLSLIEQVSAKLLAA
jgi:5-methylthioribose kinase